ncbi:MAG: electron transport complex subunit E, partial [Clostridia bacterium]|nr:electron transport complex subunit E [Clostridia bacterium]
MNKYLKQLKEGIVDQNPTFVQFLGMCPTLAVTTSAVNAVGMGLAATAVLIFSNMFISLLRKFIPKEVRIASYIVIISGFVTAVELLLHAFVQPLYDSLGLYIPLIVVNCIILARAEAFASKNPVLPSAVDGLAMGLGFTCSLTLIGSVREILGAGTWFGLPILGSAYQPAVIFILPAGAFLTLGMLAALVNRIRRFADEHAAVKAEAAAEETPIIPDSEVVPETPAESEATAPETTEEKS